jgi:hypothetical protein
MRARGRPAGAFVKIAWEISGKVRCDLVAYGAPDLAGKRSTMRVFPGGNRRGDMASEDVRSLIIFGFHGTRVTLISHPGPDWQDHPWRCIRILPGHSLAAEGTVGLPAVRIPDIDWMDRPDARRTAQETKTSYPHADSLASGSGWSFGRFRTIGLKGRVQLIRIDRDDGSDDVALSEGERVARAILDRARAVAPEALDALAAEADAALRDADPKRGPARADALRAWLRPDPGA